MAVKIPQSLYEISSLLYQNDIQENMSFLDTLIKVPAGSRFSDYEQKLNEVSEAPEHWNGSFLQFVFGITSLPDNSAENEAVIKLLMDRLKGGDPEKQSNFKGFISKILENQDSLGLGAKASKLQVQSERLFVYPEIFSDIRPVFSSSGASEKPEAAIIVHTLKVHTHINGGFEDIFMAMDKNDLLELKKTAERAIAKHNSLEKLLENASLKHVELGE